MLLCKLVLLLVRIGDKRESISNILSGLTGTIIPQQNHVTMRRITREIHVSRVRAPTTHPRRLVGSPPSHISFSSTNHPRSHRIHPHRKRRIPPPHRNSPKPQRHGPPRNPKWRRCQRSIQKPPNTTPHSLSTRPHRNHTDVTQEWRGIGSEE